MDFTLPASADNNNNNKDSKCKDNDLKANINYNDGTANVKNDSDKCSYDVGLASYKIHKGGREAQELFDQDHGRVKPHDNVRLNVRVPNCDFQLDVFQGDVIEHFDQGKDRTYHGKDRFIDGGTRNKKSCDTEKPSPKPSEEPTVPPKPIVTPKPSEKPNPVPSAVTPTQPVQIINNNNNQNNNTNEQSVIVKEVKGTSDVVTVTDNGTPVYTAPTTTTKTPDTGTEIFSLLSLVPSGLAGFLLRKKLK